MCAKEYPMKQWVKSTTIAGRLSENWEPIVHSLDCSGGIKTRLAMTTLQHSLKLLRNLDRMFVLRSKLKSTTTATVSSKEKAQPTFALSYRPSTRKYTRKLTFGVSKMLNSTCSWARSLLIPDSSFWILKSLSYLSFSIFWRSSIILSSSIFYLLYSYCYSITNCPCIKYMCLCDGTHAYCEFL